MAINFSGEFTTPRTQQEVFDFLSDPNRFAPLLPDFQSMTMQDATHFTVKVRVGVGNIRGSAEIKMELAETVKPHRAQYKGQGTAVGSQVTVTAGFDLQPNGEQTNVQWKGETSVFGKLASMAGGMLEPLGRKNIQKLIDGLQKALAEPAAAQTASAAVEATKPTAVAEAPAVSSAGSDAQPQRASAEAASPSNGAATQGEASSPNVEASVNLANRESANPGDSAPANEAHGNDNA